MDYQALCTTHHCNVLYGGAHCVRDVQATQLYSIQGLKFSSIWPLSYSSDMLAGGGQEEISDPTGARVWQEGRWGGYPPRCHPAI